MNVSIRAASALCVVALASVAAAEDYVLLEFEKRTLTNLFYSEGAAVGDFNGDGKNDVVAGPFWYEGPDFRTKHEIYEPKPVDKRGYSANFFAFADDVDHDGKVDVVVLGFPGKESWWFKNPGDAGGRWPRHVIADYVGNESPAYQDVDGDGVKDAIFISKRGQYGYAHPDPEDATKPWVFHAISPLGDRHHFTHGMGLGDVNGDGRLDLLEKSGWWEQPPKGTQGFWKRHAFEFAGPGGSQMYVYDFDGDGDGDVVSSLAAHAYGLAWFEQVEKDGKIDFKRHLVMGQEPRENAYGVAFSQLHALELIDMDGDGLRDVVTGKRHWAHGGNDPGGKEAAVLYWFRTVRDGDQVSFVPHRIDDDSGVGTEVVVEDVDGDGTPDVVSGNKLGCFIHLQRRKVVSKEEWEAAQPKPTPAGAANRPEDPADRTTGVFPKGEDGRTLNFGFETGTLEDWKAGRGRAFAKQPVRGDTVFKRRGDMHSRHVGDYWIGGFEIAGDAPKGALTSVPFEVAKPWASFLVGGGSHRKTRVDLVDAESDKPVATVTGVNVENLRPVVVDLRKIQGKRIYVRLVDEVSGGWGHVNFDDFRLHDEKPEIANALAASKLDSFQHAGLDPDKAAGAMTVPEKFSVKLLAAEPDVRQPIAMTLDDRGRLWVAEAYEYPLRAKGDSGRDRILIFEDEDGDGAYEKPTVFLEGLNLVSGLEVGFGGVFVGAAPYLYFVPDADGDDVPDGKPEVLLDGWGWQDTHETLNSFIWGPDGWLYGCHGIFTHSKVGKPGASYRDRVGITAGIWRYHPIKREFEVWAHGTSNPWGVDFDDYGQCFETACVIPHLWHMIQGARYHRQAGSHFNPHTYDDIKTIAEHRHFVGPWAHAGNGRSSDVGGGHAHSGAMIYLGGSWPDEYRSAVIMNNIHGARLNMDLIEPKGSGYVGKRSPDFLFANDSSSQLLYFRYGPDGDVVMIDWYDAQQCHRREPHAHDRGNGRIFKVIYGKEKVVRPNLQERSDMELCQLQLEANDWWVRHARRVMQERAAAGKLTDKAVTILETIALRHKDETRRLRGLWALQATGKLSADTLDKALSDPCPQMRGFAIQFACENRDPGAERLRRFAHMAVTDPSAVVRLYLASAADRLPLESRWEIVAALSKHSEDATDHNLPLMNWYAAEPLAKADAARAMKLASESTLPPMREYMSRRIASEGTPEAIGAVVDALAKTDASPRRAEILRGMAIGLKFKRKVAAPAVWATVAAKLDKDRSKEVRTLAAALDLKFGSARAMTAMRTKLADASAKPADRRAALAALLESKDAELAPALMELLKDPRLRGDALKALPAYGDAEIPGAILAVYGDLSPDEKRDALQTLGSRVAFASALLEAVEAKKVPTKDLGAGLVRDLRNLGDASLSKRIGEVWGTVRDSSEDKKKRIAAFASMLASKPKTPPDVHLGRAIYAKTCGSCHDLFGTGGKIGPGLTGSNRKNAAYVLENVVDPSALIPKEYRAHVVALVDGRVLTGIVAAATPDAITLQTANERLTVPVDEIEERRPSDKSMMPDDQLGKMSEHEVRSLVAYLAAPNQVPMLATEENAPALFDGETLAGWTGDKAIWSVENGEIVGRSGPEGLKRNSFLVSDLLARDFRLSLKVKLVDDATNSGVQFRSVPLAGGVVKGYQADVGKGWWGKLYEEHGRGLLWNKDASAAVRRGDWNDYVIVASGSRVRTYLNGKLCVDLDDPEGARQGIFALQVHSGGPTEVRFKDITLELDPTGAELAGK